MAIKLLKGNEYCHLEKMATALYRDENPIGKIIKIDDRYEVVITVLKDTPLNSTIKFDFALPFAVVQKLWGVNDEQLAQNFFSIYIKTISPADAAQLTKSLMK